MLKVDKDFVKPKRKSIPTFWGDILRISQKSWKNKARKENNGYEWGAGNLTCTHFF